MAARKRTTKKKKVSSRKVRSSAVNRQSSQTEKKKTLAYNDLHIPGILLILFGMILLPVNFGLLPELEILRSWPAFFIIFGAALLANAVISRIKK